MGQGLKQGVVREEAGGGQQSGHGWSGRSSSMEFGLAMGSHWGLNLGGGRSMERKGDLTEWTGLERPEGGGRP